MQTWVALVEVVDAEFQDLQELASLWGDINIELEEVEAELQETYALLGRYDFLVVFEAPDRESVFEVSLAAERHGLDMDSMEGVPIEAFGGMVDE
ncbi:GYD domain-containing protein [Halococcus agarilyticus]|uniref:GYD domain-containing protein n=1 Tax=Halococcus agarilyticus TaxID=1232219 RepID=UPI000677CF5D|nr:GYD domain-containing protein [Halococcus agarilyticus]